VVNRYRSRFHAKTNSRFSGGWHSGSTTFVYSMEARSRCFHSVGRKASFTKPLNFAALTRASPTVGAVARNRS